MIFHLVFLKQPRKEQQISSLNGNHVLYVCVNCAEPHQRIGGGGLLELF